MYCDTLRICPRTFIDESGPRLPEQSRQSHGLIVTVSPGNSTEKLLQLALEFTGLSWKPGARYLSGKSMRR